MSSLRFLVDVNVGIAVADSLRDSGHDIVFAGDLDWCMPDADVLSLAHQEQRIILTMETVASWSIIRSNHMLASYCYGCRVRPGM
jgi:uncharacterized protein with PIN domain